MKNLTKILSGTFVLTFLTVATATTAFAYQGDPAVQGPDCTPERHTAMEAAFDASDYDAWSELMEGKGRIVDVVNADNFAMFIEAHDLAENGDFEGARELRSELGLGNGQGFGAKTGARDGHGMRGIGTR